MNRNDGATNRQGLCRGLGTYQRCFLIRAYCVTAPLRGGELAADPRLALPLVSRTQIHHSGAYGALKRGSLFKLQKSKIPQSEDWGILLGHRRIILDLSHKWRG